MVNAEEQITTASPCPRTCEDGLSREKDRPFLLQASLLHKQSLQMTLHMQRHSPLQAAANAAAMQHLQHLLAGQMSGSGGGPERGREWASAMVAALRDQKSLGLLALPRWAQAAHLRGRIKV